jgi:hypothetical protein
MDILQNAPAQYGALGLLIVAQAIVISALWRQLQQRHKELVELNDRLVKSQHELQLLLKGLVDGLEIEKLFREYAKKD